MVVDPMMPASVPITIYRNLFPTIGTYSGVVTVAANALVVTNCLVACNRGPAGGGIYVPANVAPAVIADSTIVSNVSDVASMDSERGGGGAYVAAMSSRVERCTVAYNQARAKAGGLWLGSEVKVIQCTVVGNSALGGPADGMGGGGVYTKPYSSAWIYNSTIASNSATDQGGGLYNRYGTARFISTIVAGNSAATCPDIRQGDAITDSRCLIGINAGSGLTAGSTNANGSYIGTTNAPINAKLMPLANNGGRTLTCAIQGDSLARDHGTNILGLATDQRAGRYERVYRPAADIGAYEFGAGAYQGTTFLVR